MLKRIWDWLNADTTLEIHWRIGIVYIFEVPILPLFDVRIRLVDADHR